MKPKIILATFILLFSATLNAQEKHTIRIGALAYGTVNWELTALKNQSPNQAKGLTIDITKLASPQAAKIALQSGAVDMIVSDWIWVSRQRSVGFDFTFYPYSNTAGTLLVDSASPIQNITDLKATRLGIAGGELDKNWLLLQALAKQQHLNLKQSLKKTYGAPPLLNQQLLRGNLDAIITYWHHGARLEAQGYRQIIDTNSIIKKLGIEPTVASLGYIFNRSWGEANASTINLFFSQTKQIKNKLCHPNSNSWQAIAFLTQAQDKTTENLLRKRYCAGRVSDWGLAQQQSAAQIYQLLKQVSQNKLTGPSSYIQPGTFWKL